MKLKKSLHIMGMLLVFMIIFTTTANAFGGVTSRVRIVDGDEVWHVSSAYLGQITVAELLEYEGIELGSLDVVEPALDVVLERNASIIINRAFDVFVRLDGASDSELIIHTTRPDINISRFVADYRIHTGLDFVFEPDLWAVPVEAGMIIDLRSRTNAVYESFERVPFFVEYEECDELLYGEREVYAEGRYGILKHTSFVERISGEEVNRQTETEVLVEPANRIIHIGTYVPEPEEFVLRDGQRLAGCGTVFSYNRHILVETTAYTASFECTGRHPDHPLFGITASGMRAQIGVVAVDTNVIPFGTRMYIEGYGFALAGDRGGAIRGYKIDLFMNSRAEAFQWGRRHNIRVWILDDYSEFPLEIIPR